MIRDIYKKIAHIFKRRVSSKQRAFVSTMLIIFSLILVLSPIQFGMSFKTSQLTTSLAEAENGYCQIMPAGTVIPSTLFDCQTRANQTPNFSYGYATTQDGPFTHLTAGNAGDVKDQDSCGGISSCIAQIVYFIAVPIPSYFLDVTAALFSLSVKLSLSPTGYSLNFLSSGWGVSRDMADMAFLFILIYLSLLIIFKAETSSSIQTLATVIIVALLVNFSFFATRVVIDAGNIVAVEVYNAILSTPNGPQNAAASVTPGTADLTVGIMNTLNIQGLLSSQQFGDWQKSLNTTGDHGFTTILITLSCIYLSLGIITIILAFAFLTAAINFLGRIVALWFAIILSPFAFVAFAIPGGRSLYTKWQNSLITNMAYPAIFLFIYFFLVLFLAGLGQGGGLWNSIFTNLTQNNLGTTNISFLSTLGVSVATIVIELGLIILMMKYALEYAEKFGGEAAGFAKKASNWSVGKSLGLAGVAGRQSAGRLALIASRSETLRNVASQSALGRSVLSGANKLSKASFDIRGSSAITGALSGVANANLGKAGGSGGFRATAEARAKRIEERINLVKDDDYSKGKKQIEAREEFKATGDDLRKAEERFKKDYAQKNSGKNFDDLKKQADEELRKATEEAEQASKAEAEAVRNRNELNQQILALEQQIMRIQQQAESGETETSESEPAAMTPNTVMPTMEEPQPSPEPYTTPAAASRMPTEPGAAQTTSRAPTEAETAPVTRPAPRTPTEPETAPVTRPAPITSSTPETAPAGGTQTTSASLASAPVIPKAPPEAALSGLTLSELQEKLDTAKNKKVALEADLDAKAAKTRAANEEREAKAAQQRSLEQEKVKATARQRERFDALRTEKVKDKDGNITTRTLNEGEALNKYLQGKEGQRLAEDKARVRATGEDVQRPRFWNLGQQGLKAQSTIVGSHRAIQGVAAKSKAQLAVEAIQKLSEETAKKDEEKSSASEFKPPPPTGEGKH